MKSSQQEQKKQKRGMTMRDVTAQKTRSVAKEASQVFKSRLLLSAGLVVLAMGMSGCAGMNGDFGCNAKGTDSCTSIAQVDQGNYAGSPIQTGVQSSLNINPQTDGYNSGTPMPGDPIRRSESIQRVWVAPFQDTDNNYHEPSYVYFVEKQPTWIGVGAKEIQSDGEGDN